MKNPLSHSLEKDTKALVTQNSSPSLNGSFRDGISLHKKKNLNHRIFTLVKKINNSPLKYLFMGLIKLYQWTLGPFTQGQCRFYPSCSEYGLAAFKKYGVFKGAYLTIKRILKCNPWHSGGPDPIP